MLRQGLVDIRTVPSLKDEKLVVQVMCVCAYACLCLCFSLTVWVALECHPSYREWDYGKKYYETVSIVGRDVERR